MSALAFNLLSASILVVLVLLLREPVARAFGARAAFALWLAPALRLLMPPLSFPGSETASSGSALEWIVITERSIAETASWAVSSEMLVIGWIAGMAAGLGWAAATHLRFVSRAVAKGHEVQGSDVARVIATPVVDGPVATGLFRKLILVPTDFEQRFSPDQQRLALLHEEMHHRRGDLWAMAAAIFVRSALWFNPIVYPAFAAFRRDMESACDASLLKETGNGQAETYGETILRSASRPVPQSLCALTSFEDLKRRLTMLKFNHGKGRMVAGLGVAAAVVAGGLAIAMPANADGPKKEERIEKKVIKTTGDGNTWVEKDGEKMKCPGEMLEFSTETGDENNKSKNVVAMCMKGADKAAMADGLEKALEEMGKDSDMDAASRADLERQIRAKIAELRS